MKTGDRVPNFTLRDQNKEHFTLHDQLGDKNLVIYFYPKDDTPGCTAQACTFRDHYEDFEQAGAVVIGISSDDPESHKKFAEKHRLPFRLLSDPNAAIRKLFDVPEKFFGMLPGRVTYVLDKNGKIHYVFNSQLNVKKHIEKALTVLHTLN